MKPSRIPGMNSTNFLRVYSFSRMIRPTMMLRQKYLQIPIFPPRTDSHTTANKMPPVPFHPMKMLKTTEAQNAMQSILRCRSLVADGRQGISSHLRRIARQLTRNEMRQPMKTYCRIGMEKYLAVWICPTTKAGTRMMRVRDDRVILGSLAVSLYSKSCQSMPATMEASLLILGTIGGRSLSLMSLSLMPLLVIQIDCFNLDYYHTGREKERISSTVNKRIGTSWNITQKIYPYLSALMKMQ